MLENKYAANQYFGLAVQVLRHDSTYIVSLAVAYQVHHGAADVFLGAAVLCTHVHCVEQYHALMASA